MIIRHILQPRLSKLRRTGIRFGQTIVEVYQHFWVILVFPHLCSCHKNGADATRQVFDFTWEDSFLQKVKTDYIINHKLK